MAKITRKASPRPGTKAYAAKIERLAHDIRTGANRDFSMAYVRYMQRKHREAIRAREAV